MRNRRAAQFALASALAAALMAPAAAEGTVTIGSNLGRVPTVTTSCDPSCTRVLASLTPAAVAQGGLPSPVNGTVVTWRIRVGNSSAPATFRVIRRFAGDLATGAGTSATVTPPIQAITAFPTRLPIAIGEWIGVDCCVGGGGQIGVSGGSGRTDLWLPALADGGPPRARFQFGPQDMFETAINADIEPTSTFSVKTKSKKGGKVLVTVNLPNAGRLVAGDKSAKLASAAASKKKVKFLKSKRLQAAAPGKVDFVVKASKAGRSVLADKGKLKTKLKLVFTPTGGNASTEVRKVKLKP